MKRRCLTPSCGPQPRPGPFPRLEACPEGALSPRQWNREDGMAERDETTRWEAEQFRLLVEHVKDYAIFILDPLGKIVTWSKGAERLLGYTAEEAIGQNIRIFFTPEDRERGEP